MKPAVKYTLARLGLFLVVLLLLWPIPGVNVFLKLMIALLVSMVLSWFLLRGLRDELTEHVDQSMQRRAQQQEKLRDALEGRDSSGGNSAGNDSLGSDEDNPQGDAGNRPDVR